MPNYDNANITADISGFRACIVHEVDYSANTKNEGGVIWCILINGVLYAYS